MPDASAADPASIGVSVLLANWTKQDSSQIDYAGAATDQLEYLLYKVPHTSDGAISHRVSQVQLWCVPEFSDNMCSYIHEGVILCTWCRLSWLITVSQRGIAPS